MDGIHRRLWIADEGLMAEGGVPSPKALPVGAVCAAGALDAGASAVDGGADLVGAAVIAKT